MRSVAWWRGPEDLDVDQKQVIILSFEKDWLLLGPPGSGKSNVLVLRGSLLTKSGKPNFQLLTFTRVLSEFMQAGATNLYALPDKSFRVFFSWCTRLLREHGVSADELEPGGLDFQTKRALRLQQMQALIASGKIARGLYDAVLVDEVQDFWSGEIEIMRYVGRRLFVVGDSRQRIYSRNEGIQAALAQGCQEKQLRWHYRTGRKICETADAILPSADGESLLKWCQYKEADDPSSRALISCESETDQAKALLRRLRDQLRVFRGEYIGILCPNGSMRDRIWNMIEASDVSERAMLQSYKVGYERFGLDTPICVMTVHAAKGLEFKAVHLPFAERLATWPREVAFTAVTRAKTSLTAYSTRALPGWFEGAFAEVPEKMPELEDLWINTGTKR